MKCIKKGFVYLSACTLTISNIDTSVDFTSNQTPGAFTFRVNKGSNPQSCDFFVGFSKGSASDYTRKLFQTGGYSLDFNVRQTSVVTDPVLKDYPDTSSSSEVFVDSFSSGAPLHKTFTYYPTATSLSTTNNFFFGLYSDTLSIHVYESTFPPAPSPPLTAQDTANVTYTYTVPRSAIVSLLDVSQSYSDPAVSTKSLTFSSMTQGQTVSFDLVLIYNAGYDVTFQSTNGQKLKHSSLNSYVDYSISMTGVPSFPSLASGTPVTILNGTGVSAGAPTGDRHTTTITLGDPSSAFAGSYSESIAITLTSTQ